MGRARFALRLLLATFVLLRGEGVDTAAENGIQWLGDACNNDGDCNAEFNLQCDQHQHCTCKSGYVSVQFSCKQASRLGEACAFPNQCQYYDPHSFCNSLGRCSCVEGFERVPPDKCIPEAEDEILAVWKTSHAHFSNGDSHYTSFNTGLLSLGLLILILTGIIGVICFVKFIMSSPAPPQPSRRCSRKHTYLKMNYFKAPTASEGEKKALLREAKQPPSYVEATGVPQIVITDYSTIPKSTTTYAST
ncbi:unnamed protein product [Ixodes hexagonus]